MNKFKKFIKLFIPPLLLPSYFKKFYKSLIYKNKFNYDNSLYNRGAFINRSIIKLSSKGNRNFNLKYLEIGCEYNQIFNTIPLAKGMKIGVDPERGGTHRQTSDDFFKNNSTKFDLIFIDGLHTYEQCQKDVINSLNFINEGGIILLHDMLPQNSYEEKNHRSGDVWKVAVELQLSKNLEFKIANVDCGVGIIKPQPNHKYFKNDKLLHSKYNDFISDYFKDLQIVSCEEAFKFIDKD